MQTYINGILLDSRHKHLVHHLKEMETTTLLAVFAIVFPASSIAAVIDLEIASGSPWRIVGGKNAVPEQFPWQVSIRSVYGDSHYCGGSILNSKWILTAAHCVVNTFPWDSYIVVGSITLSSGGDRYNISRIIAHKDYDPNSIKNDVAVLELEEEIEFSPAVQPIKLESELIEEVDCVVSGWGRVETGGARPDILQYIWLKSITFQTCQTHWSSLVGEDEICTLTKAGEGVCHGDSGSPLVADGKQIGIVSWGNPCANGKPDVFTRISSYLDWIEDAI